MKNLKVFSNEEFGKVSLVSFNGKPDHLIIEDEEVDRFKLLALALKISYQNESAAWEVMKLASILFHPQDDFVFNSLYDAVAIDITRVTTPSEFDVQDKFKNNIKKMFGEEVKLINKKNNPKHIPDAWLEIKGEEVPVEIKLNDFNKKALDQLKRYMKFYKCRKGIAVAKNLLVKLPKNIKFISSDEMEVQHELFKNN